MKLEQKMIKYISLFLLFFNSFLFAENINQEEEANSEQNEVILEDLENTEPSVDCLILEGENSIICKFQKGRDLQDEQISLQWIAPNGELSRSRDMIMKAGHASLYDYRYIQGRELGVWTFKVIFKDKEYTTNFELK